jgi:hypothetical protein
VSSAIGELFERLEEEAAEKKKLAAGGAVAGDDDDSLPPDDRDVARKVWGHLRSPLAEL